MASVAIEAGAHALGLVFYAPSPRHLTIEQAAAICHGMAPFVTRVGVMVNPDADYVRAILKQVPLNALQYHGEESPGFCASFGLPYIKGVRVSQTTDLRQVERDYADASALLLDTHVPDHYGGTGQPFDWQRARYGGCKPVILAGGLTAENVGQAITLTTPYAVDVSSGVETEQVKDPLKIRAFCRTVLNHVSEEASSPLRSR